MGNCCTCLRKKKNADKTNQSSVTETTSKNKTRLKARSITEPLREAQPYDKNAKIKRPVIVPDNSVELERDLMTEKDVNRAIGGKTSLPMVQNVNHGLYVDAAQWQMFCPKPRP